jgi:hypothetical protein
MPVSTEDVKYFEAPSNMQSGDLNKNENLILVGNNDFARDNGVSQYMITNQMSHINMGGRNNTGFMFASNKGNEAAHEFGHMLGLSDRYLEGVTAILDNRNKWQVGGRVTIPLLISKDNDPNYNNNLMAGGAADNLTEYQLRIAFNRNKNERNYQNSTIAAPELTRPNASFGYTGLRVQGKNFTPIIGVVNSQAVFYYYRLGKTNSILFHNHQSQDPNNGSTIERTSDNLGY